MTHQPSFTLRFFTGTEVFLGESASNLSPTGGARQSVRGKTAGPFPHLGTFQWTSAVKAACILLLRHKLYGPSTTQQASIWGGVGSLAASLDFAISKRPVWLVEMFGVDCHANSIAPRLFPRINSNRKRGGPVVLFVHERLLPPDALSVYWDGRLLQSRDEIGALLNQLEAEAGESAPFALAANA